MASGGTGQQSNRISPRKFSEKIALLNKKEREANKKFEEIIKEVQATKQQQNQQQACSQQQQPVEGSKSNNCAPLLQDELRLIDNGVGYQAVHADSLEEIEKVYRQLIKSVGHYDENDGQENDIYQRLQSHNGAAAFRTVDYNVPNLSSSSVEECATTNAPVGNPSFVPPTIAATSTTTGPFYQHVINMMDTIPSDLCESSQQPALIKDSIVIPRESSATTTEGVNFATGESDHLGICSSLSYKTQQQVPSMGARSEYSCESVQFKPVSSHRARVVSFGSASRYKYPCATSNLLNQQDPRSSNHHQQSHRTENLNYHTQYLKEPSGDRSRQKSCSDPQLHISPNQIAIVDSNAQYSRSENRLADNQHAQELITTAYNPNETAQQSVMNCYYAPDTDTTRSQEQREAAYNLAPMGFCQDQPVGWQEHLYGVCDTTSTLNQLPGIKICTIEDETMGQRGPNKMDSHSKNSNSNTSTPPSRDGSLPDISILKFGTNSTSASPERDVIAVQKQTCWPRRDANTSISGTNTAAVISSQPSASLDLNNGYNIAATNWSAFNDPNLANIEMDVQVDSQPQVIQSQYVEAQHQPTSSYMAHGGVDGARDDSHRCWPDQSAHQPFRHPLPPKVDNSLSNSERGFNTSSTHQQQGSLMICTSSEFYNNIIRSRSHSNISSMNQPKRGQHVAYDALQQIEPHHTSECCLPTNRQPVANVRRIAELKADRSSTSPLNSLSDLNSPRSEMNSPASSTTEQCESSVLILNSMTTGGGQNECRFASPAQSSVNGDSSTLGADKLQFAPPCGPITLPENHEQEYQHQAPPLTSSFCQSVVDQSHQLALGQDGQEARQVGECLLQTCHPMSNVCSQILHNATNFTSPQLAPANANITMDENGNQSSR